LSIVQLLSESLSSKFCILCFDMTRSTNISLTNTGRFFEIRDRKVDERFTAVYWPTKFGAWYDNTERKSSHVRRQTMCAIYVL